MNVLDTQVYLGVSERSATMHVLRFYLVLLFVAGGFKGYGLAMMVEVFSGILADAAFGPNVRKWKGDERVANLVSRLQ